jgi:hypothetical protein
MPLLIRGPLKMDGVNATLFVSDIAATSTDLNDVLGYIHSVEQAKISIEATVSNAIAEASNLGDKLVFPNCSQSSWPYLIPYGQRRLFVVRRNVLNNRVQLQISEYSESVDGPKGEVTTHLRDALAKHSIRFTSEGGIWATMRSFEIGYSPDLAESYDRNGSAQLAARTLMHTNTLADINDRSTGGVPRDPIRLILNRWTCFNPSEILSEIEPATVELIVNHAMSGNLDSASFDDSFSRAVKHLGFDLESLHVDSESTQSLNADMSIPQSISGFVAAALEVME